MKKGNFETQEWNELAKFEIERGKNMDFREMKHLALLDLKSKGYVIDGSWEGGSNWLGVYARPKSTPKYGLDSETDEEARQRDGIDYSKWFEWFQKDFDELAKTYLT